MIPVLRKVAQLNVKYRKKWGSIIQVDVCIGAPPDEVTAWHAQGVPLFINFSVLYSKKKDVKLFEVEKTEFLTVNC